jgi:hypothetical protein
MPIVLASPRADELTPNLYWQLAAEGSRLWSEARYQLRGSTRMFDVHPDGIDFALALAAPASSIRKDRLMVVLNFFEELRCIAPAINPPSDVAKNGLANSSIHDRLAVRCRLLKRCDVPCSTGAGVCQRLNNDAQLAFDCELVASDDVRICEDIGKCVSTLFARSPRGERYCSRDLHEGAPTPAGEIRFRTVEPIGLGRQGVQTNGFQRQRCRCAANHEAARCGYTRDVAFRGLLIEPPLPHQLDE